MGPLAPLADAMVSVDRRDVESGHCGVPLRSPVLVLARRLGDLYTRPRTAGAAELYEAGEA